MKKVLFAAIFILALCSLLVINTGIIKGSEPGYERVDWFQDSEVTPTIDGQWTTDDEWLTNGEPTLIGENVSFQSVWSMDTSYNVYDTFLVEFFSDTTDDAGDYWQMCIDGGTSGGATPQTDDYKIEIVGHTDLTVYQGNGLDWTAVATPSSIDWDNTLSTSPTNSTAHWILELYFLKTDVGAAEYWYFRLAAYDEDTGTLSAWPPTDPDVPDGYGYQDYVYDVYPEGFTIAVVVLLSSVAVVVGFYCLRKRPKTEPYKSGKLNSTR